jgi:hypothetical protein
MLLLKTRDFVLAVIETITSVLKIILLSKITFNFKLKSNKEESLVILGNGPSLNKTLEKEDFINDKKLLCVNYFGRTDEYEKLKPSYYVVTSLEYFFKEEKEEFAVERRLTLESIANKTNWPLTLFIPAKAKARAGWKQIFKDNRHISIFYFNTTPISGFNFFTNFCYRNNLGMPRPHNVLIPALVLMINLRFPNIYICGADHTWLQELYVNEFNEVLLSQKHFYDERSKKPSQYRDLSFAQPMYHGGSKDTRKLHEVLEKFYYTFRSYWKIKDYAETKEVNIYNVTPISYIDAFKRVDITQDPNK